MTPYCYNFLHNCSPTVKKQFVTTRWIQYNSAKISIQLLHSALVLATLQQHQGLKHLAKILVLRKALGSLMKQGFRAPEAVLPEAEMSQVLK